VDFLSKIYTFLTQKKVNKPPLATFLQTKDFFSTVSDKNLGTSFILKDKGLEKLEDKRNLNNQTNNDLKTEEKEKENKLINETSKSSSFWLFLI
jgi:hypothetical protein